MICLDGGDFDWFWCEVLDGWLVVDFWYLVVLVLV